MLVKKTKGFGLDIPQAWFFFSLSLLFCTSSSTLGRSVPIVVRSICNSDAKSPFASRVQLCRVQLIRLLSNLAMHVIVVIKAIRMTPAFVERAFCADRSGHLPRWRRSVLAPVCLWKYLFSTEVGRDRRGQRWCRSSVFAHEEMADFFPPFCLYGGTGARKLQSFTLVFEWGSLTMQAHFQIPIPTPISL